MPPDSLVFLEIQELQDHLEILVRQVRLDLLVPLAAQVAQD